MSQPIIFHVDVNSAFLSWEVQKDLIKESLSEKKSDRDILMCKNVFKVIL